MSSPAIAPFVSAISVMLGAYGFFYNAYKGEIEKGLDTSTSVANNAAKTAAINTIKRSRSAARILAGVPIVVFLLLTPQLYDQFFEGTLNPGDYSTLDVLFVVLSFAWLAIAWGVSRQVRTLTGKLTTLEALDLSATG